MKKIEKKQIKKEKRRKKRWERKNDREAEMMTWKGTKKKRKVG